MATFYFNGAADVAAELPPDWQTLGNWWMSYNAETNTHSVPATSLPTSADSIEVRGTLASNSGSEPTVANAAFFGEEIYMTYNDISITVTGLCTFNGVSNNVGTITGNCNFNDSSYNFYGTIIGDCNFNDSSNNSDIITGNCNFNDNSFNIYGFITGDCNFNDSSYNYYGTITGLCTFNDSSYNNYGTIAGAARFGPSSAGIMITVGYNGTYGSVEIIYDKGINGSSILGVI